MPQLQAFQGIETNKLGSCLTGADVLQGLLDKSCRLLAPVLLLNLSGITQQPLLCQLAVNLPGLANDGSIIERERGTVCNHVIKNMTHGIAVFPRRKVIKIQRNKIMLTNLTVTITVRLVEPRINEGMLLPVGTDFCSCLDLDIHRCKVRQNPNIMQPPVYHTFWGLRTV